MVHGEVSRIWGISDAGDGDIATEFRHGADQR